jgi:hypothetical protein
MTLPRAAVLVFAWLAIATGAGYATYVTRRQRVELDTLAARARQLEAEAAMRRQEHTSTGQELTQAEAQLSALPASIADDANVPSGRRAEIDAWVARVQRLRAAFDNHPSQRIPEMQFLQDRDWLRIAKTAALETEEDIRRTRATVRTSALNRFGSKISMALRAYSGNPRLPRPATVQLLAGYFDPPVDPLLLARYEIVDRPRSLGSGSDWAVRNKEAVDPEYDIAHTVNASGTASTPFRQR